MSNPNKTIEKLNDLLKKNYDARDGYVKAMEDVKDPALRNYFEHRAERRSEFSNELTDRIRSCDGKVEEEGSTTGSLHRKWMDIKSSLSGDKEEAILKECIRGDKASVQEYEKALESEHLDTSSKGIIRKEKIEVEQTLEKIETMKDVRKYYG